MLVVDHQRLDGFERHDDNLFHLVKKTIGALLATSAFQPQPEVGNAPLVAVHLVVVLRSSLHGDVGEMDKQVVELSDVARVVLVAKPTETILVQVCRDGPEVGDEYEQPQVELLAPDQQRTLNVPGYDIRLPQLQRLEGVLVLGCARPACPRRSAPSRGPLAELCELGDQEDAPPLGLVGGLHDPGRLGVLAELLHKQRVVRRQQIRRRHEIV
mmetsp:Transcript_39471/g.112553  ORF Transcript_39471/g.112553 Transcript_39471/m.112553 type:complete len:213 (-) Transcript_39471:431-1069(-)